MRKIIVVVLFIAVLVCFPRSSPAQKGGEGLGKLMQEKLNSSKLLLEGIALCDFTKIGNSAEKLIQVSKSAEWFVLKTPRYELHSNEFRRAAEVIVQKAKDKNLDGVALAYFDMTMSCIRCHRYVREVRDARLPIPRSSAVGE
ncbi:MAG: hypothetical protein L0215_19420 [Gemmataceae bacterium]|nr:hypothetical protein [Gemmataceae bacterium]